MRLIRLLIGCGLVLGVVAGVSAARAADITWSSPSNISADSDVSTTGTLVGAYNIGNTGVGAVTLNGVTFAAFPIADGSTGAANANLSVAGFSGSQTVTTSLSLGSVAVSSPFVALSPAYQTLLSSGVVKSPFVQILDMNLLGLTVGNSYTIQLWVNDSAFAAGSPAASRLFSDFNGDFSPLVDANTTDAIGGTGQYIFGSFVANAASEFVSVHGAISQSGSDGAVLNALQIRTAAVPEPTSLTLIATGAVAILLSRRTMNRIASRAIAV